MVRYVRFPVAVHFSGYDVQKRKMKSKLASSKPTFNYSEGTKDVVVTRKVRQLEFSTV